MGGTVGGLLGTATDFGPEFVSGTTSMGFAFGPDKVGFGCVTAGGGSCCGAGDDFGRNMF
jgi:hypothetical protein